jgi:oxalate decarboxylase/phosphoglucose isomerase-like protein (cupin superfamily)
VGPRAPLGVTDRYVGKLIAINAGRRLSLQYHERKDESIYVVRGRLRLHLEDDDGKMAVASWVPATSPAFWWAVAIASRPSMTSS